MMRSMFRRLLAAGAIAVAALSPLSAASAEAASLPARAEIRTGRCVEPASFRKLVASRYHVEFNTVVATDIDRDGDLDIVATTDRSFTVWLNDGMGHLTSQPPSHAPAIDGRAPAATWRESGDRSDPTTDDGGPSIPLLVARAHAPPAMASDDAAALDFSTGLAARFRVSPSRAPPL
jgi:FG-GAP-like repeat